MRGSRDFTLLWLGEAVSDLGSAVTVVALPLVALTMPDASTFRIGVGSALATAGWPTVALSAGALVDRVAKQRLMIACDAGRGIVVAPVPAATAADASPSRTSTRRPCSSAS